MRFRISVLRYIYIIYPDTSWMHPETRIHGDSSVIVAAKIAQAKKKARDFSR